MSGFWYAPSDYEPAPYRSSGAAHSVSSEREPYDPAEEVRLIAEEVTGKKFDRPKRSIGFIVDK